MKLTKIGQWLRDRAVRLATQERGAVSVDFAVVIGIVLLVAASILAPHVTQLVNQLVSTWSKQ